MPSKREDRKEQSQLSPQTQAIIDTLEKEGKLLRTDGRTHSLKNIRADLAKFDGVFNRIATALDGQKDYFDKMGNMNKELLEQQKNEEALKQVAPDASESTNSVSEDTSQKTKKEKKEKTESGGVTSLLKSILPSGGMMKNLAMAGGGMFLAYNFVKGFIDEKSNGAFTEFEDSMIETFKKVDWSAVGSSFVQFAEKVPEALTAITKFIASPAGALLGIGALGLGMPGALAHGAAAGAAAGAARGLFSRGGPQPIVPTVPTVPQNDNDVDTSKNMKKMGVGGALLAAAGVGVIAYGDKIAEFIAAEAAGMTPEEIAASEVVDTGGILIAAAGGALTFGRLFGAKGVLAGIIIGAAVGITRKVAEVISRSNEEATQQALDEEAAILQKQEAAKENAAVAQKMLDDADRDGIELSPEMRANLERQAAKAGEIDNSELISDTNQEIGEQLAKAEQRLAYRKKSGPSFRKAMPGGGFVDEKDLSATEMAEIQANFDAKNTELEAEIETIRQVMQNRIANSAGKLSEKDFIYVDPEGFWENLKALFGQNSLGRLADSEEQDLKDNARRVRMMEQIQKAIKNGNLPPGITYIDSSTAVGGTSVQHVNASKGSTTSIASSVVGGGGGGGRSKTLILTAGSD